MSDPERRRFLSRLVREVARADLLAIDHASREARRLGEDVPPVAALRAIAEHAAAMRPRFNAILSGYEVPVGRGGLGAALASLRDMVVDRMVAGERAYRIALLDLRHGGDVVRLLREASRADQLLGVIRWCDDWLSARRPLLSHAERELAWFAEAAALAGEAAPAEPARAGAPDPQIHALEALPPDGRPSSNDQR